MSIKLPGIPESEGSTRPLKIAFFATFAKTQVEKNLMRDLIYPFCPNKMNFNVKKKMDQIKVFGWPYLLRNW